MNASKKSTKLAFKLPLIIAAVALLAFAAPSVNAEVYKCTGAKNQTTYSDIPCSRGKVQEITNAEPSLSNDLESSEQLKSSVTRQLDAAVKAAIADDDYVRAQALAVTQKQRDWINAAKKEYATREAASKAQLASNADKASSAECLQARRDLERAANGIATSETLNAKSTLVNAACGSQTAPEYAYHGDSNYYLPVYYPRYHHKPTVNSGYTSPPYDRTMASPFGSRFIRPEDASR